MQIDKRKTQSPRPIERAVVLAGLGVLLFFTVWAWIVVQRSHLMEVSTLLVFSCFLLTSIIVGLNAVLLTVVRIGAMNRLSYVGDGWVFRGSRIVNLVSLSQRIVILSFVPILVIIVFRRVFFGEALPIRWMLVMGILLAYTIAREHPFVGWRIVELPTVKVTPEDVEVRPLFGEEVRGKWSEELVFGGFASWGKFHILKAKSRAVGSDSIVIEAGAMSPFQLENLLRHFSNHPEDRALLDRPEGGDLLASLMKVPW